jgi:hypothetical protein
MENERMRIEFPKGHHAALLAIAALNFKRLVHHCTNGTGPPRQQGTSNCLEGPTPRHLAGQAGTSKRGDAANKFCAM